MKKDNLKKTAVDLSSILHTLAAGAGVMGLHRFGLSALTNGIRRSGVAKNIYNNAAKEGLMSAFSGKDILPKYRRALGSIAPTLTGLTDYEVSKAVGTQLLNSIKKHNPGLATQSIAFKDLQREALNNPTFRPILNKMQEIRGNQKLSPIAEHLTTALTEENLPNSKFIDFLKRRGMGEDSQQSAMGVGGALQAALGTLTHGPVGAAANLINSAPELLIMDKVNKGNVSNLVKLKKGLIGEGAIEGIHKNNPQWGNKIKNIGLNLIDPGIAEMKDFGRDIGNAVHTDSNMFGANFGKNALNYFKKNMVEPARQLHTGKLLLSNPNKTSNALASEMLARMNFTPMTPPSATYAKPTALTAKPNMSAQKSPMIFNFPKLNFQNIQSTKAM